MYIVCALSSTVECNKTIPIKFSKAPHYNFTLTSASKMSPSGFSLKCAISRRITHGHGSHFSSLLYFTRMCCTSSALVPARFCWENWRISFPFSSTACSILSRMPMSVSNLKWLYSSFGVKRYGHSFFSSAIEGAGLALMVFLCR